MAEKALPSKNEPSGPSSKEAGLKPEIGLWAKSEELRKRSNNRMMDVSK